MEEQQKQLQQQQVSGAIDWHDTPWAKYQHYQNEWWHSPPPYEVQRRLRDELFSTAVDVASAYMKQGNCFFLSDAMEAMQTQYTHLEEYGFLSKQECAWLFEQKLQQINNDPLGQMDFFQSSYEQWKNPAFVVAFYVAIEQKLLPPDRVVCEVCMEYTSKAFSPPTDSDDEDT